MPTVRAAGRGENTNHLQSERIFSMTNCSTKQNPDIFQIHVAGRHVGEVTGGIFKKSILGSRHILRKPPALALSVESLTQAEQVGASEIQITDTESGRVYSCSIEFFKGNSFPIQRGGFEPQLALPIGKFDVTSPLEYSSRALKRDEVRQTKWSGKRRRNPRGVRLESPRQLLFKGMV